MENKGTNLTPEQALDRLEELYEQSVNALREAIADYVDNGTLPDPHARLNGLFVYPSLSVSWDGATPNPPKTRAFGRFNSSRLLYHYRYAACAISRLSSGTA